jgi:hypothetical protein
LRSALRLGELALSALPAIAHAVVASGFSAATHHVRLVRVYLVVSVVGTWGTEGWDVVIAMCSVLGIRVDDGGELGS